MSSMRMHEQRRAITCKVRSSGTIVVRVRWVHLECDPRYELLAKNTAVRVFSSLLFVGRAVN